MDLQKKEDEWEYFSKICYLDIFIFIIFFQKKGWNRIPTYITGSSVYIGTLHTKVNISFNKRLNLTTKFSMLGF